MVNAQDSYRNYVVSKSYLDETASGYTTSVQYFDGLGRKTQLASNASQPDGKFIYTYTQYDRNGRDSVAWLPRTGGSSPNYIRNFVSGTTAPYGLNDYPFSCTTYDAMSRPTESTTPGYEWHEQDKTKRYTYGTNTRDQVYVKKYIALSSSDEIITDNGSYDYATLFSEEYADEDGYTTVKYKDHRGNLILERHQNLNTYYIYDLYDNLRFVLTPRCTAIDTASLHQYAYIYKYDNLNRCIEKKLPSCASTTYDYDFADRVVFTQDGLLEEKGLYRITLYDHLGRLVLQGTTAEKDNRFLVSSVVSFSDNQGYRNTGYDLPFSPVADIDIEIVNYYDSYEFIGKWTSLANSSYYYDSHLADNTYAVGSLTGQMVATSDGHMLYNTFYYDQKGRVIDERHSTLYDKMYKVISEYSFTDKPTRITKVIPTNQLIGARECALTTSYTYNPNNDQLQTTSIQCGDNGTSHVVSSLTYDDLGRIATDYREEINDTIRYSQDLHGWTKGISGRYFTERLHYADNEEIPCFNGDISSQEWIASDDSLRVYSFIYNANDMLGSAIYKNITAGPSHNSRYDEKYIIYNSNGAITHLYRKGLRNSGTYGYIDMLTYTYDGEKVRKISDGVSSILSYSGAFEYQNNNTTGDDFEYNSAGMLIRDKDKGISLIGYNNIGLVDSIVFNSGAKVVYVYSMTGEKLRVRHYAAPPTVTRPSISPFVVGGDFNPHRPWVESYEEDMYYGDDVICSTAFYGYTYRSPIYKYYFGNGYLSFTADVSVSQPVFSYFSKDHLGNIRSVVRKYPNSGDVTEVQKTHYYPFGGIIADISTGTSEQNRLYNGKELDRSNNLWWYDYGARQYDPTAPRFLTPDPLAEKYYGWSIYGYCRNNPIKRIDVDGLYDWENIDSWSNYPVIAVFPIKRDDIMQIDYEAAQGVNLPIITVSDVSDLEAALNDLPLNGNSFDCIAFNSHGNKDQFYIGSERVDIERGLDDLKDNLEGKTIYIGACNTGQKDDFIQILAGDTNATIIAPEHRTPAGYKYDGSNFLNYGAFFDPTSTQYKKSNGLVTTTINNFTIDKNRGPHWDNKLYFE